MVLYGNNACHHYTYNLKCVHVPPRLSICISIQHKVLPIWSQQKYLKKEWSSCADTIIPIIMLHIWLYLPALRMEMRKERLKNFINFIKNFHHNLVLSHLIISLHNSILPSESASTSRAQFFKQKHTMVEWNFSCSLVWFSCLTLPLPAILKRCLCVTRLLSYLLPQSQPCTTIITTTVWTNADDDCVYTLDTLHSLLSIH